MKENEWEWGEWQNGDANCIVLSPCCNVAIIGAVDTGIVGHCARCHRKVAEWDPMRGAQGQTRILRRRNRV